MKRLSKFLQIFLPLALGIFLIWYFYSKFSEEQWNEMVRQFQKADYFMVVLSVVMSMVSHLVRAHRWGLMLQPLGYQPGMVNKFLAVSVAYFMNLFIPKSGEVSRAVVLKKYEAVPFEKGFGTIISERIVDLVFLMLFTAVAVILEFQQLFDYVNGLIPFQKLVWLLVFAMGLLFAVFLYLKKSTGKISSKIKDFVKGLKEGVFSIFKMNKKGAFIFQSFIIWGLYILSFYTATQALDETSQIGFGITIITFVVGSFTFAFTNSGVGYYPLAIAGILFIFGIPETTGSALGWIVWTSNIIYIIISGVLAFLILPVWNKKRIAHS